MEVRIQELHKQIKELFPDAVSVKIFVNADGIEVTPNFRTDLENYTMKTITGRWVAKRSITV